MIAKREISMGAKECVYNRGIVCAALARMQCRNGASCPLFKTEEDVARAERKTIERLNSLPEEKQSEIADRLFNGHKPWKGDGTWDTRAL
jgi:hypothetical protein